MVIFWFRRDLRIDDNHALFRALKSGFDVLPIFIFDTDITNKLNKNDHRINYINKVINELNDKLLTKKKKINTFTGKPKDIIKKLIKKLKIKEIYVNKDYEPYAHERDNEIKEICEKNNVTYNSFKDHVIFEEDEIVKTDGTPYVVYTPYSKKWIEKYNSTQTKTYNSEKYLENLVDFNTIEIDNFKKNFKEKNYFT
jgi:deoxyribodipyrimidine photo-lyase